MNKHAKTLAILAVALGIFGYGVTRLFGTTVSSKFNSAQVQTASEVTFGGPVGDWRPARPAQQVQRASAAPTNPVVDARHDRFSTFALDVDTASYTYSRALIESGGVPLGENVRVEEFVNYFEYDRRPARAGTPFGVHMTASPWPHSDDLTKQVMRVQLDAREIAQDQRKPAHLTFLIDVSGSMTAPNKLPLAKKALTHLVRQLGEQDTVAIATYAGRTALVLPPTPASDRSRIEAALEDLRSGGGTAMGAGMDLAYRAAAESYVAGHINRVIVVSDGDANIGATSHEGILQTIQSRVDDGIRMTTVGVGMGNVRATLMEQLADKGDGNAYYFDDMREAKRVFGKGLTGTLEVVAKDAKIQVEFDPKLVKNYRLLGYENREIADHEFRDDSVDAGEVGAGHQVTAVYEVELFEPVQAPYATAHVRWMEPDEFEGREGHYKMKRSDIAPIFSQASRDHQFAIGVAQFALAMRSPDAASMTWSQVIETATGGLVPHRPERRELIDLIRKAAPRG